jgi:hypothetical protein
MYIEEIVWVEFLNSLRGRCYTGWRHFLGSPCQTDTAWLHSFWPLLAEGCQSPQIGTNARAAPIPSVTVSYSIILGLKRLEPDQAQAINSVLRVGSSFVKPEPAKAQPKPGPAQRPIYHFVAQDLPIIPIDNLSLSNTLSLSSFIDFLLYRNLATRKTTADTVQPSNTWFGLLTRTVRES